MTLSIRTFTATALILSIMASPVRAATCSASTSGMAFGGYDPLSARDDETSGTIKLTCDGSVSAVIAFTSGDGSYAERRMVGAADLLRYNLYVDSARNTVWGDGTNGSETVSITGSGDATIYGRIPARQNVKAGTYTDTIEVVVSY